MAHSNSLVKVRARLLPSDDGSPGFGGESPWAEPVDAHDGGGTYALRNSLVFAPLVYGDVVRCELDGNSMLQIVEVVELVPATLVFFEYPVGQAGADKELRELSRMGDDVMVSRVAEGLVQVAVTRPELVEPGGRAIGGWRAPQWWETVDEPILPDERAEAIDSVVDFDLDTSSSFPTGPVDYWAAEDPGWAELGITDVEALASLQQHAVEDPRVLATIRAGRHADVITFLQRVYAEDPRTLPPLDRPLLVDPDEPEG